MGPQGKKKCPKGGLDAQKGVKIPFWAILGRTKISGKGPKSLTKTLFFFQSPRRLFLQTPKRPVFVFCQKPLFSKTGGRGRSVCPETFSKGVGTPFMYRAGTIFRTFYVFLPWLKAKKTISAAWNACSAPGPFYSRLNPIGTLVVPRALGRSQGPEVTSNGGERTIRATLL